MGNVQGNRSTGWRAELVGDVTGDVLEIGIGSGANLPYYRRARTITGLELNAESARRAQAAAGRAGAPVKIDVAPAEALPYPDASFDHVVSSLVFCSVTDPRRALAEIRRVLRPGGVLHLVEHIRPHNPVGATLAAAATPLWRRIAGNCHLDRPTLDVLREEGWQVTVHRRRLVFVRASARPAPALPSGSSSLYPG